MSHGSTRITVPGTSPAASVPSPPFEPIFKVALLEYETRYRKRLASSSLISALKACNSADAVITELRNFRQSHGLEQPRTTFAIFLDSTSPAVLYSISATLGIILDVFFVFAGIIAGAIGAILAAIHTSLSSKEALGYIFEDIELFFSRLEIYLKTTPSMMDISERIMFQVLCVLAIAEQDRVQGRPRRFIKKLMGGSGLEHAVGRLDRLMQQEVLIVAAQGLNGTHCVDGKVMDTSSEVLAPAQDVRNQSQGAGIDDSEGYSQRSGDRV